MSAYDVPEIGLVLNKNFKAIKQYVAISVSTQCTKTKRLQVQLHAWAIQRSDPLRWYQLIQISPLSLTTSL